VTQLLSAQQLRRIGIELFGACGAPPAEADIVARELVDASLMGLDSHGVVRYAFYVDEVRNGHIHPGAPWHVVKETPTSAVLDFQHNFGPLNATRLVEIVRLKAQQAHMACGVSLHSHHIGRLGATVQKLAEGGLFGFAVVNSYKGGHWVVPWGGRAGRLATNPLAYAVPTSGRPVVLDMSTSMIAEGKIRVLMHQGKPVPPGCILDGAGRPTTDPRAFYGPPHGTILPLGGALGYKGFGLSLLVEVLGSLLAGEALSDEYRYMNGLCVMALDPEAFCGRERFRQLMDDLCAYVTSSPPAEGSAEVVMPGTLDYRTYDRRLAEGIPVDDETWRIIGESATKVGVSLP
jgi:hydroxycarboxylate dehydrogenase B